MKKRYSTITYCKGAKFAGQVTAPFLYAKSYVLAGAFHLPTSEREMTRRWICWVPS